MRPMRDITRHIFEQMKAGDREAFDRFFERNAARALIYINYHMGHRLRRKLEPTDILQNIYLKVFKNFESFKVITQEHGIHYALIRMADHEITEAYRDRKSTRLNSSHSRASRMPSSA